jgi:magnesium transporter
MATQLDASLLRKAVRTGSLAMVRRLVEHLSPKELALALLALPPADVKLVLAKHPGGRSLLLTLHEFPDELLGDLLRSLDLDSVARLMNGLEPDDAKWIAEVLADALGEETRDKIISRMEPDRAQLLKLLLHYAPGSAGGTMVPRYVAVSPQTTVDAAIETIREAHADIPMFYLYVLDQGRLVGTIALRQLVRAPKDTRVEEIMAKDVISVPPEADQEMVAKLVAQHNLLALPVVDDGYLVGVVTVDDVIDVLEQEATEDMYNMAGLSEGDRVFSPAYRSLVKRLPWNVINLATSLLAATVVSLFEGTIAKMVALATFMPVIAGIGGNTGNQTLTVIIRGITLGELEFSSGLRALFKEILVGLSIGLVLGLAVAIVAYLWKGSVLLGGVIALAMAINLLIAALVGTAIPLTLKRLGLDPALGGSILVTMCTDVFGFLALLGLATLFMRYLT